MATTPATVPEIVERSFSKRMLSGDPIAHTLTGMAATTIVAITKGGRTSRPYAILKASARTVRGSIRFSTLPSNSDHNPLAAT